MGAIHAMVRGRRQQKEFRRVWNSKKAYRPDVGYVYGSRGVSADEVLHRLADWGNGLRMTAGDCGELACAMLEYIDWWRSYDRALKNVFDAVGDGRIVTVSGYPMRDWVPTDVILDFCEAVAVSGRAEAFSESMKQDDGSVPRGSISAATLNEADHREEG